MSGMDKELLSKIAEKLGPFPVKLKLIDRSSENHFIKLHDDGTVTDEHGREFSSPSNFRNQFYSGATYMRLHYEGPITRYQGKTLEELGISRR